MRERKLSFQKRDETIVMISKEKLTAIFCGFIISMATMLIMMATLLKLLWVWIMPELFPGAVAQGLVVPALSWSLAFKLVVFVMVLAPFFSCKHTYIASEKSRT